MPNYKESIISGTEYIRCCDIYINNPLNGTPIIRFNEERITTISNNRTISEQTSYLTSIFDPDKVITLLNTTDNVPTGATITYGEVYNILYSLYIQEALVRDTIV